MILPFAYHSQISDFNEHKGQCEGTANDHGHPPGRGLAFPRGGILAGVPRHWIDAVSWEYRTIETPRPVAEMFAWAILSVLRWVFADADGLFQVGGSLGS